MKKHWKLLSELPSLSKRREIVDLIVEGESERALNVLCDLFRVSRVKLVVGEGFLSGHSAYYDGEITIPLPEDSINPYVILHEFAHHLLRERDILQSVTELFFRGGVENERFAIHFPMMFLEGDWYRVWRDRYEPPKGDRT
ncbi:MAG: hypothetical protein ACE5OO_01125 [Candidatus Bathyarchaeia archaeon]